MTDFNYWRVEFDEVEPLNCVKPNEVAVDELKIDEISEVGFKIDMFCSDQLGSDDVDILSDVAVNSRSERCFVSDSEHELELKRSIYDKLECQLEKLEELIMCKADLAGDIAGLKK